MAANMAGSTPPFLIMSISRWFSSRNSRINLSVGLSLIIAVVLMAFALSAEINPNHCQNVKISVYAVFKGPKQWLVINYKMAGMKRIVQILIQWLICYRPLFTNTKLTINFSGYLMHFITTIFISPSFFPVSVHYSLFCIKGCTILTKSEGGESLFIVDVSRTESSNLKRNLQAAILVKHVEWFTEMSLDYINYPTQ